MTLWFIISAVRSSKEIKQIEIGLSWDSFCGERYQESVAGFSMRHLPKREKDVGWMNRSGEFTTVSIYGLKVSGSN